MINTLNYMVFAIVSNLFVYAWSILSTVFNIIIFIYGVFISVIENIKQSFTDIGPAIRTVIQL